MCNFRRKWNSFPLSFREWQIKLDGNEPSKEIIQVFNVEFPLKLQMAIYKLGNKVNGKESNNFTKLYKLK